MHFANHTDPEPNKTPETNIPNVVLEYNLQKEEMEMNDLVLEDGKDVQLEMSLLQLKPYDNLGKNEIGSNAANKQSKGGMQSKIGIECALGEEHTGDPRDREEVPRERGYGMDDIFLDIPGSRVQEPVPGLPNGKLENVPQFCAEEENGAQRTSTAPSQVFGEPTLSLVNDFMMYELQKKNEERKKPGKFRRFVRIFTCGCI